MRAWDCAPTASRVAEIEGDTSVEVAPVKPFGVDKPEAECSASRMKTTKIVSYLQGTIVPFAFLVAPAVTQLGCARDMRGSRTYYRTTCTRVTSLIQSFPV